MPGRVLIVAYNFPPIGGVGIQRTVKHAAYLPLSGWEPVVLTAREPGWGVRDPEGEAELPPNLVVARALSPEPVKLRRLFGRAVRLVRHPRGGRKAADPAAPGAAARGSRPPGFPTRWALRMWGTAMRWTFYPDEQIGWVPFAVRRGMALHRDAPFDAVYSSSPPVSSHLAAAIIARRAGVPWIADFRDPWIGNAFAAPPPPHHRFFQRRIERRIARVADRVVMATDGLARAFADRYPEAAARCLAIPNGYDRSDLPPAAEIPARSPDGRFHLVYGGSLYGTDELAVFLDGLEMLLARRPEVRDRLTVEFVGQVNLENRALASRYAAPDRLGRVVSFAGFMPHRQALGRMLAADGLLQLIAAGPGKGHVQGGKLMEYIGLDRPILAVVPDGDARVLLSELDWGVVADPTPEGVADGLERLLAARPSRRRADPEGRYDRLNLSRRLGQILDELPAGRRPS